MHGMAGLATLDSIWTASENGVWESDPARVQAMAMAGVRMCDLLHSAWTCSPWVWMSGMFFVGASRVAAWTAVFGRWWSWSWQ